MLIPRRCPRKTLFEKHSGGRGQKLVKLPTSFMDGRSLRLIFLNLPTVQIWYFVIIIVLREHFFLVKLEFFWDTEGPRIESRKSFVNSRLKVENL